jgi:hypothetical protein
MLPFQDDTNGYEKFRRIKMDKAWCHATKKLTKQLTSFCREHFSVTAACSSDFHSVFKFEFAQVVGSCDFGVGFELCFRFDLHNYALLRIHVHRDSNGAQEKKKKWV